MREIQGSKAQNLNCAVHCAVYPYSPTCAEGLESPGGEVGSGRP